MPSYKTTYSVAGPATWGLDDRPWYRGGGLALAYDFVFGTDLNSAALGDSPTPIHTRASNAAYFDSSGVLQTAANDVARFDHHLVGGVWVPRGLLREEARTNFCLQSEDFTTTWVESGDCTPTANQISAPDGAMTADELDEGSTNTVHRMAQTSITITSGETYTVSCFAKDGDAEHFALGFSNAANVWIVGIFNLVDGTLEDSGDDGANATLSDAGIEDVGNDWYRCWIVGTLGAVTSGSVHVGINNSATLGASRGFDAFLGVNQTLHAWGVQLEAGAFPTSYISTTTVSVPRAVDIPHATGLSIPAGPATFFAEFELAGTDVSGASNEQSIIQVDDDTSNNRVRLSTIDGTGYQCKGFVVGNSVVSLNNPGGSISAETVHKAAIAYATNDAAVYLDGTSIETDLTVTEPNAALTVIRFGYGSVDESGGVALCGWLRRVKGWAVRKPAAFPTQITS